MILPVLSLKFLVAFYHYYCAQIPEQIEELRGEVVRVRGLGGVGRRIDWTEVRTFTSISNSIRFPGYYLEFQLGPCNCRCMRQFALSLLFLQVCVCLLMDRDTVSSGIKEAATSVQSIVKQTLLPTVLLS
jgi:hypothetical protein